MKKALEITNSDSCLSKAGDDEPIFVLRAQDKFAPALVELWAILVEAANPNAADKVAEARRLAQAMAA